jgi:hypothetical protein
MSNIGVLFRTAQLRHTHPTAFAALPEPYQEDDCLVFYMDANNNLCSEPDEDQTAILGHWTMVFDELAGEWVQTT